MKISKLLSAILTTMAGTVLCVEAQSWLTNGLVAYYPFNGNANDASGSGHHGTVNGATPTTDRFGQTNQAYLFGGTTAYITAPFSATVFSNDFTASVWFNAFDIPNGWHTLLDEPSIGPGGASFNIVIPGNTCGCAGPGHLIATASYPGPSFNWFLDRSLQTPLGTYHQVVITKAGTNVTMYLDSQVAVTGQVSNPTSTQPGNTLWIGRAATEDVPGAYVFHGVLDDIRIYNRALSSNEVTHLYAYESVPQLTDGLVAYFPFSGNADDASGNGHDGTVYSATLTIDRFGIADRAYNFTGGQHIDVPLDASSMKPLTYSVWFNKEREGRPAPYAESIVWTGTFDATSHDIGILAAGSELYADYYGNLPNGRGGSYYTGYTITLNTWYHVVVTYSDKVRVFVNGNNIGEVDYPATPVSRSPVTRIGADQDLYVNQFEGVIDDIRIYSRALSAAEVRQLYELEGGPRVDLIKAVKPSFSKLSPGANYQLQVSGDMSSWTNHGSPFSATNTSMVYPQYWDVENWGRLFFRLQAAP